MMAPEGNWSMARSEHRTLPLVTTTTLSAAVIYAAALVAAGFLAPVYSSTSSSSSGAVTTGSETLVGVNGPGIVVVLCVPLLAAALVAVAVRLRSRRGWVPFAWVVIAVLGAFNLLAMLSIGVFVLPVTLALIVATGTCRSAARQPPIGGPAVAQ
jgi:hypothetical protein